MREENKDLIKFIIGFIFTLLIVQYLGIIFK